MPDQYLPAARKSKLLVRELAEEVLVYDEESHRAHCLNPTAALVWEHCDGKTPVAGIAGRVGRQLSTRVAEEVVWSALEQLAESGLLAPRETSHGGGAAGRPVSRRRMIRGLGLAAAVSLPLVTSIVAPTPAQAQSPCTETSCPPGTSCNGSVCEPVQEL